MIISPCISICKTDPVTGYCYGCGRSDEEKKTWKSHDTSDLWKEQNLVEVQKNCKTCEELKTLGECTKYSYCFCNIFF